MYLLGKNQYMRYIDHSIADKSLFIYNPVIFNNDYPKVLNRVTNKQVTYLGSLVPSKYSG